MIHETAIVHPSANVHSTATIGPYSIIGPNVTIGQRVLIGPHCIIGMPAEHKEATEASSVVISDNCIIHGGATIDAGTANNTFLGKGCYIMKQVHIGHDAILSMVVTIAPGAVIGGHVLIRSGVNIGMNVSVHQRLDIPPNCMIGAGTVLPRAWKGEAGMKYVGVGRCIGENVKK